MVYCVADIHGELDKFERLLELIRQEDPSRPLSDQKLAELLAEQGIRIARRTVAKYRTELRLGSAAARKRD